ncbi:hypothetical protein BKA69DRAFT_273016 [Paraphysoderma sedebokerense]|nr:hypothetical protein BKA69DRAFT_273016 [Paraphysoderma sedebokerense]
MGVVRSGSHQFNRQFDEFQVCGSQYQSAGLTTPVADVQSSRTDTASLVEHMTIDLNQSVDCSKDANSKLTDDNLPNHQDTACCNENPSTETYILPVHSGCPSSRSILTTSRRVDIQTQTNPLDFDSLYRLKLKPRNMPKLKIKGVISNPAIKFVFTPCALNYSLAKSNHSRSTIVKNSFRENEIGRDHASATKVSSGGDANSRTMKTTQSQTLIPHGSMESGKFSRSDAELNKKPRGKKKKLEAGEPVKPRNAFQSFLGDKM